MEIEILEDGEVDLIQVGLNAQGGGFVRPPRPSLLRSEGLNHYVAQVLTEADGTKITNTGTNSDGGPVVITARMPCPSASEVLDDLPRRTLRLQVAPRSL